MRTGHANHLGKWGGVACQSTPYSAFGMLRQKHRDSYFTTRAPISRAGMRRCDHPDCQAVGEYRAPKGRDLLNEYYWFCLDHVRAYNQAWDYCKGMSPGQIEVEVRRSTTWERPTWRMGPDSLAAAARRAFNADAIFDDLNPFASGGGREQAPPRPTAADGELAALSELGLPHGASMDEIKTAYKVLAKRHHPDANRGDPASEERFKTINLAYATLKNLYGS